jgi:hypothetical protein
MLVVSPFNDRMYESVNAMACRANLCRDRERQTQAASVLADFRSPSRVGGARFVPHHTRLNRDRLSATLNFWNPPPRRGLVLCDLNLVSAFMFGNVSI